MGTSNPYRLKPLIGARVPVNTSYSPMISMQNPHSNSLQVVEMFSSGGSLHIELPTGAAEATRNMWVSQSQKLRVVTYDAQCGVNHPIKCFTIVHNTAIENSWCLCQHASTPSAVGQFLQVGLLVVADEACLYACRLHAH